MWEVIQTIIALAMMANMTGGELKCYEDFSQCWIGEFVVDVDNEEIFDTGEPIDYDKWAIVASVYVTTRHNFQAANYYYQVWWNWHWGMITADDALANVGYRPDGIYTPTPDVVILETVTSLNRLRYVIDRWDE